MYQELKTAHTFHSASQTPHLSLALKQERYLGVHVAQGQQQGTACSLVAQVPFAQLP